MTNATESGSPVEQDTSTLNILDSLRMFRPVSAGSYEDLARLTLQAANQCIPFLASLAESLGSRKLTAVNIEDVPTEDAEKATVADLKVHLDREGSDKATTHNYHYLYGALLANRARVAGLLEVGMGSNNDDVVSNMGIHGTPGASLRAFRSLLPNAHIYGADVDKRILFREERINTYFVDQTDLASFRDLAINIPNDLDLIIDDGLHSPNANIATLMFGLDRIRVGGWMVVEDIGGEALPVWSVVAALLSNKFQPHLFRARHSFVFGAERIS